SDVNRLAGRRQTADDQAVVWYAFGPKRNDTVSERNELANMLHGRFERDDRALRDASIRRKWRGNDLITGWRIKKLGHRKPVLRPDCHCPSAVSCRGDGLARTGDGLQGAVE